MSDNIHRIPHDTWWWRGYMPGAEENQPDVFVSPYPGWTPRPDGSWGGYARVVGPFDTWSGAKRVAACLPVTGKCEVTDCADSGELCA